MRGIGQVDLQANPITGALILVSLWVAGWDIGLFATIGTVVSTATARVLRVDRANISQGLQGFSGCLTGIALVTSLGRHPSTYLLAVAGAILCTLVTAALTTVLAPYELSALTAPFCVVSGVMVVGAPSFSRVWHEGNAAATSPSTGGTGLSWHDVWHAFFSNVAQVFLTDEWYVGLIMLVGLAFAGWWVLLYAALGSVVGIVVAWALGAPAALIADGIYGYNAVLAAIAVGAVFLRRDGWNGAYALFGAAVTTGLTASLTVFFKPFGGHTFTWPFVLTTWVLMAAVPQLPRFRKA
nr:urea transporter [Streptomyces sp. SID3343]